MQGLRRRRQAQAGATLAWRGHRAVVRGGGGQGLEGVEPDGLHRGAARGCAGRRRGLRARRARRGDPHRGVHEERERVGAAARCGIAAERPRAAEQGAGQARVQSGASGRRLLAALRHEVRAALRGRRDLRGLPDVAVVLFHRAPGRGGLHDAGRALVAGPARLRFGRGTVRGELGRVALARAAAPRRPRRGGTPPRGEPQHEAQRRPLPPQDAPDARAARARLGTRGPFLRGRPRAAARRRAPLPAQAPGRARRRLRGPPRRGPLCERRGADGVAWKTGGRADMRRHGLERDGGGPARRRRLRRAARGQGPGALRAPPRGLGGPRAREDRRDVRRATLSAPRVRGPSLRRHALPRRRHDRLPRPEPARAPPRAVRGRLPRGALARRGRGHPARPRRRRLTWAASSDLRRAAPCQISRHKARHKTHFSDSEQ